MVRAVILPFVKIEELSDEEREKSNVLPLNNITFTVLYCFHYVVSYSISVLRLFLIIISEIGNSLH